MCDTQFQFFFKIGEINYSNQYSRNLQSTSTYSQYLNNKCRGCSSLVQCLPRVHSALSSIPALPKPEKINLKSGMVFTFLQDSCTGQYRSRIWQPVSLIFIFFSS